MRCGVDQELQISLMGDMYRVLSFLKLQAGISKLPLRCQKGCSGSSELRSRVLSMCKDLDGLTGCSLLVSEKLDFISIATFECLTHTNTWSEERWNGRWREVGRGERTFISSSFDLWILVVTSTSGFGLKVYRKVMLNLSPVLKKRCMNGNKNINIQLGHKMLTQATQWVGFTLDQLSVLYLGMSFVVGSLAPRDTTTYHC